MPLDLNLFTVALLLVAMLAAAAVGALAGRRIRAWRLARPGREPSSRGAVIAPTTARPATTTASGMATPPSSTAADRVIDSPGEPAPGATAPSPAVAPPAAATTPAADTTPSLPGDLPGWPRPPAPPPSRRGPEHLAPPSLVSPEAARRLTGTPPPIATRRPTSTSPALADRGSSPTITAPAATARPVVPPARQRSLRRAYVAVGALGGIAAALVLAVAILGMPAGPSGAVLDATATPGTIPSGSTGGPGSPGADDGASAAPESSAIAAGSPAPGETPGASGGGQTPAATRAPGATAPPGETPGPGATPVPTPSPGSTPTAAPTASPAPTLTPSPAPTPTPSPAPTGTPSPAPTATPSPSPQPPNVDFTFRVNGQSVSFTNQSDRPATWLWSFGDGTTATLLNPTHTYADPGTYSVTLKATNAAGGSASVTKDVPVP